MKLAGIAVVAAAGTMLFAATSATQVSVASTSQPPCVPKITTVKGATEVGYCGPATATVKVGKKTYKYTGGYCGIDAKNKIPIQITLGVISEVKSPVNDGQPLFQLSALTADGISIDTVTAEWKGKQLESVGTVSLKGKIPSSGTFASKGFGSQFSGSWNCHGVVVTTP